MPTNYNLLIESFRWFTCGEYPISTPRSAKPDNDVTLLLTGVATVKMLLVYMLSLLLVVAGGMKVIRRQRK